MKHRLFALFERPAQARSAIEAMSMAGLSREDCSIIFHRDALDEFDTTASETDARKGAIRGFLGGGATGAVIAGLLGGAFFGVGPIAAALVGMTSAGAMGALGGGLIGAAAPDTQLQKLLKQMKEGSVLVTAEIEGLDNERLVESIFEEKGAVDLVKQNLI